MRNEHFFYVNSLKSTHKKYFNLLTRLEKANKFNKRHFI